MQHFQVLPQANTTLWWTGYQGAAGSYSLTIDCGATPTPTDTPTLTPSPTHTATNTPTATSTPSPEPAGTQVYLPVGLAEYSAACARYEPNDSIHDPYGPLVSGQLYFAYICEGDENDYYYFEIGTLNPITVDLTQIPDGADYDLFLYDTSKVIVAESRQGDNGDEHISYVPTVVGRYYIRVWPDVGYSNTTPYQLVVVYDQTSARYP